MHPTVRWQADTKSSGRVAGIAVTFVAAAITATAASTATTAIAARATTLMDDVFVGHDSFVHRLSLDDFAFVDLHGAGLANL